MLGRDLVEALEEAACLVEGLDLPEFDVLDGTEVQLRVQAFRPDTVYHLAAMTQVDRCEDEVEAAYAVNGLGTRNVALASDFVGARFVYVSTDYVFSGRSDRPWEVWDRPDPVNVYGATKLAGEILACQVHRRCLICRTSWVFGRGGRNFVEAILEQVATGRRELEVVEDQRGAPTYARDLAACLVELGRRCPPGIVHVSNGGECSWKEFAEEILRQTGHADIHVRGISTEASGRAALRPARSLLGSTALRAEGLELLPSWQDALSRYLAEG